MQRLRIARIRRNHTLTSHLARLFDGDVAAADWLTRSGDDVHANALELRELVCASMAGCVRRIV